MPKPRLDERNPLATVSNPDGTEDLVTVLYYDVGNKAYTVWNDILGIKQSGIEKDRLEVLNEAAFTRIPFIGLVG